MALYGPPRDAEPAVWGGKSLAMLLDASNGEPLIKTRGRSPSPGPPPPAITNARTASPGAYPSPAASPGAGVGVLQYARAGSHESDGVRQEVAHALLNLDGRAGTGMRASTGTHHLHSLDRDPYVSPGRGGASPVHPGGGGIAPPADAYSRSHTADGVPVLPLSSSMSKAERRERLEQKRAAKQQQQDAAGPPADARTTSPPALSRPSAARAGAARREVPRAQQRSQTLSPPPPPAAGGSAAVPLLSYHSAEAPVYYATAPAPVVHASAVPPAEYSEPLDPGHGWGGGSHDAGVPPLARTLSPPRGPSPPPPPVNVGVPRAAPPTSQHRDHLTLSPPDPQGRSASTSAPQPPPPADARGLFTPSADLAPVFRDDDAQPTVPHRPVRVPHAAAPHPETVIFIDDGARASPVPALPAYTPRPPSPQLPPSTPAHPDHTARSGNNTTFALTDTTAPASPAQSRAASPPRAAQAYSPPGFPRAKSPVVASVKSQVQTPARDASSPVRPYHYGARPPSGRVPAKAPPEVVRSASSMRSPRSDYGDVSARPNYLRDTQPGAPEHATPLQAHQVAPPYGMAAQRRPQPPLTSADDDFGRNGIVFPEADGVDSPLLLPNDGRYMYGGAAADTAGDMEIGTTPSPAQQTHAPPPPPPPPGDRSQITVQCLSGAAYTLSHTEGEPFVKVQSSNAPTVAHEVTNLRWIPETMVLSLDFDRCRILFSEQTARVHLKKIRGFLDMSQDVEHNLHLYDYLGRPVPEPVPITHTVTRNVPVPVPVPVQPGHKPASPRRPTHADVLSSDRAVGGEADEYDPQEDVRQQMHEAQAPLLAAAAAAAAASPVREEESPLLAWGGSPAATPPPPPPPPQRAPPSTHTLPPPVPQTQTHPHPPPSSHGGGHPPHHKQPSDAPAARPLSRGDSAPYGTGDDNVWEERAAAAKVPAAAHEDRALSRKGSGVSHRTAGTGSRRGDPRERGSVAGTDRDRDARRGSTYKLRKGDLPDDNSDYRSMRTDATRSVRSSQRSLTSSQREKKEGCQCVVM